MDKSSSEPSQKPTVSPAIPILEESCKRSNLTPRLGESHPIRGSKRLDQPKISDVNLYESSSMASVKGMDPVEASSEALSFPPEVGINQVGESDKVSSSSSCQYFT